MRKTLLAAVLFLSAVAAKADIQAWVGISSDVASNITVTSAAPVEVDNLDHGATGYVLAGRTQILMTIPKGSAAFDCAYSSAGATATSVALSTQVASANYGAQYATTATQSLQVIIPLPSYLRYWCQSEGITNPLIHIEQQRPVRDPLVTPPN